MSIYNFVLNLGYSYWLKNRSPSIENIFTEIYKKNVWADPESRSGFGSNIYAASAISEALPPLLREIDAKTILDIPCGDFNWMKNVDLPIESYIGADIVDKIVVDNARRYKSENRRFIKLDIIKDHLPQADVIFCRDCLVHFSFEDIFSSISNIIKSNSTYLLATTFPSQKRNENILTGEWRTLNLQMPPFNFPKPIKIIKDNAALKNTIYSDKSMGLWRVKDIQR